MHHCLAQCGCSKTGLELQQSNCASKALSDAVLGQNCSSPHATSTAAGKIAEFLALLSLKPKKLATKPAS